MKKPTLIICLLLSIELSGASQKNIDQSHVQVAYNSVVSFANFKFDEPITFRRTRFMKYVDFDHSKFLDTAFFTRTYFDFQSSFKNAHFQQMAYFNGAEFDGFTDFSYAKFDSLGQFRSARFASKAEFQMVEFGEAHFRHVTFEKPVNFIGSNFKTYVTFNRAHFKSDVDFTKVKFKKLSFYMTTFEKSPDFSFAVLPDTIFFEKINFQGDAILDLNPIMSNQYVIDLRQFPLEKIKLRWDNFTLYRPSGNDFNYREIRSVYIDLLKRFKDLGYSESYEACDREFKEFVYMNDPDIYFGEIRNVLNEWWWGYGYDLWKIVINTLIILLLVTIINFNLFDRLNNEVYEMKELHQLFTESHSLGHKFFMVLQYSSAIFFGFNLKMGEWNYKAKSLVLWLQVQFGLGLLCLAFVVNYFFK